MIRIQIMRYRDLEYNALLKHLEHQPLKSLLKHHAAVVSIIVSTMTLMLPSFISYEAFLSFFWIGIACNELPSLGHLISDYSQNVTTNNTYVLDSIDNLDLGIPMSFRCWSKT